jgi:6-phosphogluconolactonase
MDKNIFKYRSDRWAKLSSLKLHNLVCSIVNAQGHCNVMLTGGRSAEKLYRAWRIHPDFSLLSRVNFYFGDERCVTPDSSESNFRMAKSVLFSPSIPEGCSVFRIHGEAPSPEIEAIRYASILPSTLDILLLGVGADGHIASLFPGDEKWHGCKKKVISVSPKSHPYDRITITPEVIKISKNVLVLAPGVDRASIFSKIILTSPNELTVPASLVLDKVWLMDFEV